MTMEYVGIEDAEHLGLFLVGHWLPHGNFYDADCAITGGNVFVLKQGTIVFRFNSDDIWMYYCNRKCKRDPHFRINNINYAKWCELVERFVRYCIHKGASSWQPPAPSTAIEELE